MTEVLTPSCPVPDAVSVPRIARAVRHGDGFEVTITLRDGGRWRTSERDLFAVSSPGVTQLTGAMVQALFDRRALRFAGRAKGYPA